MIAVQVPFWQDVHFPLVQVMEEAAAAALFPAAASSGVTGVHFPSTQVTQLPLVQEMEEELPPLLLLLLLLLCCIVELPGAGGFMGGMGGIPGMDMHMSPMHDSFFFLSWAMGEARSGAGAGRVAPPPRRFEVVVVAF